jgi:hypothetical protein
MLNNGMRQGYIRNLLIETAFNAARYFRLHGSNPVRFIVISDVWT